MGIAELEGYRDYSISGLDALDNADLPSSEQLNPMVRCFKSLAKRWGAIWHVTGYPYSLKRGVDNPPFLQYSRYYEQHIGEEFSGRYLGPSPIFIW